MSNSHLLSACWQFWHLFRRMMSLIHLIHLQITVEWLPQNLDMLDYFEANYIGRFRPNAPRRHPMFNIETWNMFHRRDNELPRTINAVEGWHYSFQLHVTTCHPSFWKFINIMKQEQGIVRAGALQNQGWHPPPPQRRRYADNHARILRMVDDYVNKGRINYLRTIAHNIDFWEHFHFFFILFELIPWDLLNRYILLFVKKNIVATRMTK